MKAGNIFDVDLPLLCQKQSFGWRWVSRLNEKTYMPVGYQSTQPLLQALRVVETTVSRNDRYVSSIKTKSKSFAYPTFGSQDEDCAPLV